MSDRPHSPGQLKKYIRNAKYSRPKSANRISNRSVTNLNKNKLKHDSFGWNSLKYGIQRGEFMGVDTVYKRPETQGIRIDSQNMIRARDNLNKRPDHKSI